jgi:NTP pyrophosphatase (non-canonical NTP hydrolase)
MNLTNEFMPIVEWAKERNLLSSSSDRQFIKLQEEVGELASGLLKNNHDEIKDAIGDCVVVLTILSEINGIAIEDCINSAYNEIKDRKGKMINGTFVKEIK